MTLECHDLMFPFVKFEDLTIMFLVIMSEFKGLVSPLVHESCYLMTFLSPAEVFITLVLYVDCAVAEPGNTERSFCRP